MMYSSSYTQAKIVLGKNTDLKEKEKYFLENKCKDKKMQADYAWGEILKITWICEL